MGMIISFFSNIMYLSEKMVLWLTCVGLISCIVLMFVITLGMGIGLGYNYCFVDLRTKYKHVPGHYIYPGNPRWPYREGQSGPVMLPDTTENPLDAALRRSVSFIPDEPPGTPPSRDYFDRDMRSNDYNKKIVNETEVQDLVQKLGLGDNTTETDNADEDEEETTTPIINTETTGTTETSFEIYGPTETNSGVYGPTETNLEMTATTLYTNSYPYFDDVDKSIEMNDAINDPATGSTKHIVDPYTQDVTEPPVVDIDVDSPDKAGGKRVKKVVIPISGLDLISLLSKLKTENRNYSLQIVTT